MSEKLERSFAIQIPTGNQTAASAKVKTGEIGEKEMSILEKYSNENETWIEVTVAANSNLTVDPMTLQKKIREKNLDDSINVYPRGWLDLLDFIKELNKKPIPPPQESISLFSFFDSKYRFLIKNTF